MACKKNKMTRKTYILISLVAGLLLSEKTSAQFLDSLQASLGLESRFASRDFQPLWLVANRHGTVADRQTDFAPYIRVSNKHTIAEKEYQNNRGFYDYNPVTLSYGVSLYENNHFKSTILEEAYGKLEYKNWSFRVGRFEEDLDDIDPRLSAGSFGVSGNALPIPKIGIAVTNYTPVPFTNGWVQFRGGIAHGWLGADRYIQNSLYHEKSFFLRVGARSLKFYGGFQHFAEWGGHRGDQQFDHSLSSFKDVFMLKESNGGTHAGDHRGILEGGAYWENSTIKLHAFLQKPFEGRHDIGFGTKNGKLGVIVSSKDEYSKLQGILLELIYTESIDKDIPPNQRESYYNNSVYKTGWEYLDNVIGIPLFTNRVRASKYFPAIQPFNWKTGEEIPGNSNIVNNRIFAIHTGALYSFSDRMMAKTLLTYVQDYGAPGIEAPYAPHKRIFYGLQQLSYEVLKYNLTITGALGLDYGDLTSMNVAGGLIGIEWNFTARKNSNEFY
jgi:hypothetical protein